MTSAYDNLILSETGLISYYPLNETSGTTATDLKSGYNGTISATGVTLGVASLLASDAETAMRFDGSSGLITLNALLNPSGWTAFTAECWVSLPSGVSLTNAPRLLSNSKPDTDNKGLEFGWYSGTGNPGGLFGAAGNGTTWSGWSSSGNGTPPAAVVYHIAMTYDGAKVTCWINGKAVAYSGSLTGALAAGTNGNLTVGESSLVGGYLAMTLQKLAVYNAALSSARLITHYLAGVPSVTQTYAAAVLADSPARYYRLGDASGSLSALDASTNAQTATVNSSTAFAFGAAGALLSSADTAATLNGSGQATTTTTTGLPSAGSAATLEGWLKLGASGGSAMGAVSIGTSATAQAHLFLSAIPGTPPQVYANDGAETSHLYVDTGWHYVAVVYNGSSLLSLYLDGSLATTVATTAITWSYASAHSLALGMLTDSTFGLTGSLDEAAVYTTALSAAQIQKHYAAALQQVITGAANPLGGQGSLTASALGLLAANPLVSVGSVTGAGILQAAAQALGGQGTLVAQAVALAATQALGGQGGVTLTRLLGLGQAFALGGEGSVTASPPAAAYLLALTLADAALAQVTLGDVALALVRLADTEGF